MCCKSKFFTAALIILLFCTFSFANAFSYQENSRDLESVVPEEAGWSSKKLDEAAKYAEEAGFSALMLLHNGKMMYSWGNTKQNYKVHSIRKPFLGALYGLYVDNNTIDLDLTIEDLGIDDIPPKLTDQEKQARIKHLLQSRSGIYHPAAGETPQMKNQRPERGSHLPGTHFYYNNWDFNTLGTIFEKITGKKIFEEFKSKIADPIGMQDFETSLCRYQYESESEHPKYAFRMSARDMARFGLLFLNGGKWKGNQVIPEKWVTKSTSALGVSDERAGAGFGYMWGVIMEGGLLEKLFGGKGYFFSGYGGHSLVVLPDMKIVLVLRVDTDNGLPLVPGAEGKICPMITSARIK
ncbi:serine hydrolase domain-containing protein [candidate division KSB1 bacterium]